MDRNPHPPPPPDINRFGLYTVTINRVDRYQTSLTLSQAFAFITRLSRQYGEVAVSTHVAGGTLKLWSIFGRIRIWYPSDNGIVRADAEAVVGHLPLHNHDIRIEDDSDGDDKPRKRCKLDF